VDTPGFSSLQLDQLTHEELKDYFIEFRRFEPFCKFGGCNHLNEPVCGVKEAVESDDISPSRYKSYTQIYEELKDIRRY
jgi:ribosome biogenesis GTPase